MADEESNSTRTVPARMLEIDFALMIARAIEATKSDPTQLREMVYDAARQKLGQQFEDDDAQERRRALQALEVAIQGVERFSQRNGDEQAPLLAIPKSNRVAAAPSIARMETPSPAVRAPVRSESIEELRSDAVKRAVDQPAVVSVRVDLPQRRRGFSPFRALLVIMAIAAVLSTAIYVQRHPTLMATVRKLTGAVPALEPNAGSAPGAAASNAQNAAQALLPKTFGIYAVSDQHLYELDVLPGRVPDARVAMSAAISFPSKTALPDGRVRFIVYRRDLISNAPDRAEVRVIAKVKSAMTFDPTGKPRISAPQESWVIRNITTAFRVAPVADNPDMYEIRNENDDFKLPPGRYALVVKGAAYDFEIGGTITDPDQCLEQIQAANGTFYSPCRKP